MDCYGDCDDGTVAIPKNDFRSQFTWKCYEASRSYLPVQLIAWTGGLIFASRYAYCSDHTWWCFAILVTLIFGAILIPVIYGQRRKKLVASMVSKNVTLLAGSVEEIFSTERNNLPLAWCRVASTLNEQLYARGKWNTPYCFFDGFLCEIYFRRYVFRLNLANKVVEKNCLDAAVDGYKRTVFRQFDLAKSESIVCVDKSLPRDFYWKKPIWRLWETLKRNSTIRGLFLSWVVSFWTSPETASISLIASHIPLSLVEELPDLSNPCQTTTTNRIRFLGIIAAIAPGDDIGRWDEVAGSMNFYFKQNCMAGSFFDGSHCLEYYYKNFDVLTKRITDDKIATYELVPLILKLKETSAVAGLARW